MHGVDEVEVVMDALLRNRKFAVDTHNIMAHRIYVPDKGTVLQDFDDDGENAAGGRLMHRLQIVDASDVVVVVSRWFGGVLLGADRFRFINNAAHSILSACGSLATGLVAITRINPNPLLLEQQSPSCLVEAGRSEELSDEILMSCSSLGLLRKFSSS